jgi:2-haloacid dehalogenase
MERTLPDPDGPALENIEACVFDAYGTLFDVFSVADGVRQVVGDKADTVTALWRQKQLEYTWLRSLMKAHVDFWQVTRDALEFALDSAGHADSADTADTAATDRLMELYLGLATYPEVPGVLTTLRRNGALCAVLSNGAPNMLDAAVRSAGIGDLLSAVLSVEDAGVFKPSAAVYRLAVDGLKVKPENICFMSSNAWDIAGAAHFGFRAVWVNRFGQARERLPGAPVKELKSLEPLPGLLGYAK